MNCENNPAHEVGSHGRESGQQARFHSKEEYQKWRNDLAKMAKLRELPVLGKHTPQIDRK